MGNTSLPTLNLQGWLTGVLPISVSQRSSVPFIAVFHILLYMIPSYHNFN